MRKRKSDQPTIFLSYYFFPFVLFFFSETHTGPFVERFVLYLLTTPLLIRDPRGDGDTLGFSGRIRRYYRVYTCNGCYQSLAHCARCSTNTLIDTTVDHIAHMSEWLLTRHGHPATTCPIYAPHSLPSSIIGPGF